jgi:hypothetical protein
MSLRKIKCWYSNNCLHFLKFTVPFDRVVVACSRTGIDPKSIKKIQVRESRWLLGVDWPFSDSKFRPFPVKNPVDPDDLSPEEVQVRSELEGFGISSELLESQVAML